MSLIALIVRIILIVLWLVFGCWYSWAPDKPYGVGTTLIPWVCVLILGLFVFGPPTGIVPSNSNYPSGRP
jgi:hypothetical protein